MGAPTMRDSMGPKMNSGRHAFYACLLLAISENAEGFSFPNSQHSRLTSSKKSTSSKTALSVIMGGAGGGLTDIPSAAFGYQDIMLENVNERAMTLVGQFQDAASLGDFAASQDGLSQVASVLATNTEDFRDLVVGGSSNTLSAIPESIIDSIGNRMMTIEQLNVPEGKVVAAATATAATIATTFTDNVDNVRGSTQVITDNSMMMTDSGVALSAQQVQEAASTSPTMDEAVSRLAESLASSNVDIASTGAVENTNNILSVLKKSDVFFDDLSTKSDVSISEFARQLSDQFYQNFGTVDAAQSTFYKAPQFIVEKGDRALQEALDEANKIFDSSTSKIVEKGSQTIQTAKNTPMKAVLHVFEDALKVIVKTMDSFFSELTGSSTTSVSFVQKFQNSISKLFSDSTHRLSNNLNDLGHVKLEQVAKFVFKEATILIQGIGKIFLTFLDAFLKTFTGDTAMGHIHHLQASFSHLVADATHQLSSGMHDLGQISLQEVAVLLLSFATFVAKLLFQVASAVVVIVSGQGINEWTMQIMGSLQQELSQGFADAGTIAMGLTDKSVAEFSTFLYQLFENISVLFIEALQTLLESLGVAIQAAPLLANDAVQSVTTLTANMQ